MLPLYSRHPFTELRSLLWRVSKRIVLWFVALSIFLVILFRWVPVPITPLMVSRAVDHKLEGKGPKIIKEWKSLDELSPHLQLAVVCTEDQNFLKHHGLDFGALRKAYFNVEGRSKRRGASTITQQVAKNVFLWNGRSYVRKGLEAYFAVLIDLFWSKERIMEVYLNVIEMGDGIYGAEAASKKYFGKSAKNLTKRQAATIAAILPSPLRYSATRPSPYVSRRIDWTMQQMRYWGGRLDYDRYKDKK